MNASLALRRAASLALLCVALAACDSSNPNDPGDEPSSITATITAPATLTGTWKEQRLECAFTLRVTASNGGPQQTVRWTGGRSVFTDLATGQSRPPQTHTAEQVVQWIGAPTLAHGQSLDVPWQAWADRAFRLQVTFLYSTPSAQQREAAHTLTCSAPAPPLPNPAATVEVTPGTASLAVSETRTFSAVVRDAAGNVLTNQPVQWTSSHSAIAQVDAGGVVRGVAAGTATITAASGGRQGSATVTVAAPNPIRFQPAALTCQAGSTAFFNLEGFRRGEVEFSTANPQVAVVDPALSSGGHDFGLLCRAQGTTTLTARHAASGRVGTASVSVSVPPPPPPPPPSVTVTIHNRLIRPVNVFVNNGAVTGSVPAQSTRQVTVQNATSIVLRWELVRDVVGGRAIGDAISATFPTANNPGQAVSFEINNQITNGNIFAPLITNNTNQTWLMGVNMGLQSENRCNCTVGAGQRRVFIGYYRYFGNSNVRAYLSSNGYSGQYFYWNNISVSVGSGVVELGQ